MTDDHISVRYSALNLGSEELSEIERQLKESLEKIEAAMRAVSAGWVGEAKTALDQNMVVFNAELDKLRGVSGAIGGALVNIMGNYHRVDQRHAGLIAPA
ncbi:WXG100 family type VII secretion target [Streptomyces carpaticus]|uniref:WXG100 family type VII secretion target n=1 Tax=Streptomyces cheonanensis TaxID=312720 RepID=A0ABN2VGZ8_9ACTN|nr:MULTISPECIES: WXG100 family type VII secretion target [Streptomyces]UWM51657.1 WXG100 family type VII secretion target [Streptomyces carpaticus]